MTGVRALLFDLDGTLLDSAPDLVAALNWVRRLEGLGPLPVEVLIPHASRGAQGLLAAGMPQTAPQQFEAWRVAFLERYAQHSFVASRLYEGIDELLDYLADRDIPWGIVTNKSERLTHPLLSASGLAHRVGCVVCGDTLAHSKPDPAPVRHACALLGSEPEQTLFAGDDVRDIQAGRAAGTQVGAVFYGYGSGALNDELIGDGLRIGHPCDVIAFLARG